jgi:hypothetical protein
MFNLISSKGSLTVFGCSNVAKQRCKGSFTWSDLGFDQISQMACGLLNGGLL